MGRRAFDNRAGVGYLTVNKKSAMRTRCFALVTAWLAVFALTGAARAAGQPGPKAGDKAPEVEGNDQDGVAWKLRTFAGKQAVLLYFYPKDDTPGCTKQACGLRDRMGELKSAGVEVVGVSFDPAESHRQFRQKHQLNFTLLADPEGKIADAFGVRVAGQNRARRVSFLIGKDGRILHVTDSPDAEVHLQEMSSAAAKLKN